VRHTRRQLRQLSSLGRRAVDQQKSLLFQSPDPAQQRSVVVHQLQHKLHRIPEKKKGDTKLMAVTLLILVRFSKFFTVRVSYKLAAKFLIKEPTAPQMRRCTTL